MNLGPRGAGDTVGTTFKYILAKVSSTPACFINFLTWRRVTARELGGSDLGELEDGSSSLGQIQPWSWAAMLLDPGGRML